MPITEPARRPAASVLFFAYNQEAFVEEALLSALRQDAADFELIVVDDASRDRTRAIIEEVLARATPPALKVTRIFHDQNRGLLAAVNAAMAEAAGEVFVMMAGDDVSFPDRVRRTLEVFGSSPEVQLVYGEVEIVDELGGVLRSAPSAGAVRRFSFSRGRPGRIYAGASPCGACAAYRRRLFDVFGPMAAGDHGEDNCYWVRGLLLGQIHHDPACFVRWRRHTHNLSNFRTTDADWRRRHLEWMGKHAGMSAQWLADLARARSLGLVPLWLALLVRYAARREDATWTLETTSLGAAPWGVWLPAAGRMMQVGRFSTVLRMLALRLSGRRREKRWQDLAKLKSNDPV